MDPLQIYMREIERLPLLSAQEEFDLAKRVKAGSEEAKDSMVKANLRFVINIAKRYSYAGIPMLDLIEEGNIGLMKAVEKFDPDKGYRFSTYAAWWIKQFVTRAIANQGKTIRVPVYVVDKLSQYRKTVEGLMQKLKRSPTANEIAEKMEVSLKQVRKLMELTAPTYSLDMPLGMEGNNEFIDMIEDSATPAPSSSTDDFLKKERVSRLVDKLLEREQKVVQMRYGLNPDNKFFTLDEIAHVMGLTRERIRQIERSAVKKLRQYVVEHDEKFWENA